MSETILGSSPGGTAIIERNQPVNNLGNTAEPAVNSTAALVRELVKRDAAEGKPTMFPPVQSSSNMPIRDRGNPSVNEETILTTDIPPAHVVENSTNNTVDGVPGRTLKERVFSLFSTSSLGLSQPGFISSATPEAVPAPPKIDLQAKAAELSKKADAELARQLNTPHLIPEYANGAAASSESPVASTTEEKENIAPIAVTPEPTEERFTVPIEANAFQKVAKGSLTERIAAVQSKSLVLKLFDEYKKNEIIRGGNGVAQGPVLDSNSSSSGGSQVESVDGTVTKSVDGEMKAKESARVGGLRRLFSRGGRSILATLVITAGLGQLKPESAGVPSGAISAALHSQDVPSFHGGLGSNLTFPPRSAVTAQVETSDMAIPEVTEPTDHAASVVTSLHPSTPDTLPLSAISSTPDSSSSQSVAQAIQPASSETLTHPTEMNHNHENREVKSYSRSGRVVHYVKRIFHRNSATGEQASKSPVDQFLTESLNIPAGSSFEGTVQELVASIPEAKNFEGETDGSKAKLIAHVVYVLAGAHNPRNADLTNIPPGTLPKNIAEYVGEKNMSILRAVIETTNRTTYATNELPKIIRIMQGRQ